MGEAGFRHGMTPAHIKEIKRLEKENKLLKKLLAEKEIEGHLKTEMLKKNIVIKYIGLGLKRDRVLPIIGIFKAPVLLPAQKGTYRQKSFKKLELYRK